MRILSAIRAPILLLLVLLSIGAASLIESTRELPPNLASHFGATGEPNGWMPREGYLWLMGAIGLFLPLFLVGMGLVTAAMPGGSINLPRRDYWLSPEHRDETNRYIAGHMSWLGCLVTALMLIVHWSVVAANRVAPPRLSNSIWLVLIGFLGAVAVWVGLMVRHFSRPPSA